MFTWKSLVNFTQIVEVYVHTAIFFCKKGRKILNLSATTKFCQGVCQTHSKRGLRKKGLRVTSSTKIWGVRVEIDDPKNGGGGDKLWAFFWWGCTIVYPKIKQDTQNGWQNFFDKNRHAACKNILLFMIFWGSVDILAQKWGVAGGLDI